MVHVSLKRANVALFVALFVTVVVLLWGTFQTYQQVPPLPRSVQGPDGTVLFTGDTMIIVAALLVVYELAPKAYRALVENEESTAAADSGASMFE